MTDRPFRDGFNAPTDAAVTAALGDAYPSYKAILDLAGAFYRDWTYARTGGWMLKIHDRKKALLYLIPLHDGFRISLAIREEERDAFMADDTLADLRDRIESAKKFPEGFGLQFDVTGADALEPLDKFIAQLIAMRA
jgi:hypothetical protein